MDVLKLSLIIYSVFLYDQLFGSCSFLNKGYTKHTDTDTRIHKSLVVSKSCCDYDNVKDDNSKNYDNLKILKFLLFYVLSLAWCYY